MAPLAVLLARSRLECGLHLEFHHLECWKRLFLALLLIVVAVAEHGAAVAVVPACSAAFVSRDSRHVTAQRLEAASARAGRLCAGSHRGKELCRLSVRQQVVSEKVAEAGLQVLEQEEFPLPPLVSPRVSWFWAAQCVSLVQLRFSHANGSQ